MIETGEKQEKSTFFEYVLTHHRAWVAVFLLLPISVVYGAYIGIRNRLVFMMRSAPARHDEKVEHVVNQIMKWISDGMEEKLCTARSGWQAMSEMVPRYKLSHRRIEIGMYDILEINEEKGTVRVEPMASMGQVSRSLISRGWILPVVPELDDLTVGGLIMGFGVETSSHKYGLIQHVCESLEIVTADGKLVRCSKHENPDLFYLLPWSHGTLGFLVAAELKIIPAKKYVKLSYQPVFSQAELINEFDRACRDRDAADFVEAIVYSREKAVIMTGILTDQQELGVPLNSIGLWFKPWFYKHVESFLGQSQGAVEYIPLRHYLHRHTRSYFWAMEEIIELGNHPVFRYLLGWALPPRIELLKYSETETTRKLRDRHHVVQDMLMPIKRLKVSLDYFHEHFDLYPLWLSPMAVFRNELDEGFIHPFNVDGVFDEMFVDIGAYGTAKKTGFDGRLALPLLEKFVIENHGYQALYAKTTMSRSEFRQMFDHQGYDQLRKRLPNCEKAFDEVYEKVSLVGRISPVEMRKTKISNK